MKTAIQIRFNVNISGVSQLSAQFGDVPSRIMDDIAVAANVARSTLTNAVLIIDENDAAMVSFVWTTDNLGLAVSSPSDLAFSFKVAVVKSAAGAASPEGFSKP